MPAAAGGALVFLTSASVLVLEILAGRLLAPYVGVTLETYTGIIGVVLAGIALGSWGGGLLADRLDPRRMLGPLVVLGGALALLTVPAVRTFGDADLGDGPGAIVALSLVGFFAPAAVLSAVSPTVVKLQLRSLGATGTIVGRLSALGTAGALVGTFLTGFVLIAELPSRAVVLGLGLALVAVGVGLWGWQGRGRLGAVPVVLAALALPVAIVGGRSPCDVETGYSCVRVEPDLANPSGAYLVLDTTLHSYVDRRDPTHLEFSYTRNIADVVNATQPAGALRALHIGGGGFSLPRWLRATRPGSRSLVLEIDGGVVDVNRDRLGLRTGPDLRVRVGDARTAVRDQPAAAYDVVVGDAFGGLTVPWHLTTEEFARDILRVLRPAGVYAVNVIDFPPLRFVRAEAATLRRVFPHVALLAAPAQADRTEGGNFVLVGSSRPIPRTRLAAAIDGSFDAEEVHGGRAYDAFVAGAGVLTDDRAPVDQLITLRD